MKRDLCLAVLLVLGFAPGTAAQAPPPRFSISLNGAYQLAQNDFDRSATLRANAEDGQFTTDYAVRRGTAFDVSAGVRLGTRFGLGGGVTRFSRGTPGTLSASIPHPFFFGRPRSVATAVSGLKREEMAFNIHASVAVPITTRLQVAISVGPSVFQVKQSLIREITWIDNYPYDEAAFGAATIDATKGTKVGFNGGVDVTLLFTPRVGVGATIQYAGATVDLSAADGQKQRVKVGGPRAGGGLRLRF